MQKLKKVMESSYTPIIEIYKDKDIIHSSYREAIFYGDSMVSSLQEMVMDKTTLQLIQILDLHKSVNHTQTAIGSATLLRSLIQPPTSLELILAKQQALRELENNDKLRNAVADYLGEIKNVEGELFSFIEEDFAPMDEYFVLNKAKKSLKTILKASENIPSPESDYLKILLSDIKNLENSATHKLFRGPIYRGLKGIKTKEEVKFLSLDFRVNPSYLSRDAIASYLLPFAGLLVLKNFEKLGILSVPNELSLIGMSPIYGFIIKPVIEYKLAILPLIKRILNDPQFISTIDSVGKLDELISNVSYAKSVPHPTSIPKITDDDSHHFMAKDLRNPVQSKSIKDYVPNEVNLNGSRLTFITGPNSGGKTSYCKSIMQNQILGQTGSYVLASSASMSIADKLSYQAPQFDALQDEEGRFGTELKRTRDIFFKTSPRSLVILDELAEGTTIEEKMEQSYTILNGFHTIGNNTILVTHNHELVDNFKNQGKGKYLQVEFVETFPTHKLTDGISKESHAQRVAEKIGFSEADIKKYLESKGYLNGKK